MRKVEKNDELMRKKESWYDKIHTQLREKNVIRAGVLEGVKVKERERKKGNDGGGRMSV